jgi:phosphohistidine phosphatase
MNLLAWAEMEILVFRHGPAGDKEAWRRRGRDDAKRPLTASGRDKTRKAAEGLAALVGSLDAVASSSLLRATQTADALSAKFPDAKRLTLNELSPDAEPSRAAARLLALDLGRVAVVGHQPQLSGLVGELMGCARLKLELKKAGACLLSLESPKPGTARLEWLLKPSQLRGLR